MFRKRKDLTQRFLKIINLILIASIFESVWATCYMPLIQTNFSRLAPFLLFGLYCVLYVMYTRIYDGFMILSSRIYELITGQVLGAMIADALMFVITWIMAGPFPPVLPMFLTFLAQIVISTVWSVTVHRLFLVTHKAQVSIIVSDREVDMDEMLNEYAFRRMFRIERTVTPQELMADGYAALEGIQTVFIACCGSAERNAVITVCNERGKGIYLVPQPEDVLLHGAKQVHLFHSAVLRFTRNPSTIGYEFIKRCFDIFVSGTALLILSPLLLITAACIHFEDNGPVFYKQKRLTKNGRVFEIIKFRSMRVDAQKDGVARLSTGDRDPRVTKVGYFTRKTRIDELPQLINILKGDMTIVGPRPERPELTEQYCQEIPQFRQRLRVKAGLTGYAQVYGKYNTSPGNKLLMDMVYIQNRSLVEDMQIIFATIKVILMPDATQGVAQGQVTALRKKT